MFALEIITSFNESPIVYHFASPRIGNQEFSDYFNVMIPDAYRIVNDKDPVPKIPHSFLFYPWNYIHTNTEVFFKDFENKLYKICEKTEDSTCALS